MLRLVTWCLCYKVYILVWRHTGYNSSASNMLLWNERCDVTPCYYPKCNVPNAHTIDNNYTWFYIEVCTKKFDISFVVGKPSAYCFILVSNVSNCQIFYQKQLWMFATLFIWQLWLSLSCWCTAQCSFACRIFSTLIFKIEFSCMIVVKFAFIHICSRQFRSEPWFVFNMNLYSSLSFHFLQFFWCSLFFDLFVN